MYEVIDGCSSGDGAPRYFPEVFLFGEDGIPLQGNKVINRFANFPNDQLLIWLLLHQNSGLTRIPGVTLPLYGDWCSNFWHWCYEALPVALIAHEGGFSGTYLVPDLPFAVETLELLGIRPDRIRRVDGSDYSLECMCLLDKRRGNSAASLGAFSRIRAVLRAEFADRTRDRHRLYISRNGNPENMRKIVNEPELLALLERFGFLTLRLEDLPLAEQLAYTCNASVLIGPHGAGMTHCTFMPERSLILELFAPSYINPCILLACEMLQHRYFQVTSQIVGPQYLHGRDIEAHLQIVELTLARELNQL
jgi:capsular polysaccharide biosynthesis protein